MGKATITLNTVFVRAFDVMVEADEINVLYGAVETFFSTLRFSKVTAVLPVEAKVKVSYILYYYPDGEVKTVLEPTKEMLANPQRLVYKHLHFFGFDDTVPESQHFTANRCANINLCQGLCWGSIVSNAIRPSPGDFLCHVISGDFRKGNAPSMDFWFNCSPQFHTLVKLVLRKVQMNMNEAIKALVIPLNKENLPMTTEWVESRYVYAAIWLILNKKPIPSEFKLPARKNPKTTQLDTFEQWWPREILQSTSSSL